MPNLKCLAIHDSFTNHLKFVCQHLHVFLTCVSPPFFSLYLLIFLLLSELEENKSETRMTALAL